MSGEVCKPFFKIFAMTDRLRSLPLRDPLFAAIQTVTSPDRDGTATTRRVSALSANLSHLPHLDLDLDLDLAVDVEWMFLRSTRLVGQTCVVRR